ncbi:MAG: TonB-dependent siderophore receptor [Roseateles sp.]|uniref:TonB-dependent siderophore receptor n=1 Tax=Roseateles sp. TaxID=1971397 RepID=UPI0039ECC2F3
MGHQPRPRIRRTLVSLASTLACLAPPPLALLALHAGAQAQAAEARQAYDIPAGPLAPALTRLGREAGLLLSFSTEQTRDLQTRGLRGQHTPDEALRALLAGTPLAAQRQPNGGYLLRPAPAPAPDAEPALPVVHVQATALDALTEGSGSYTTGRMSAATGLALSIRQTPQTVSVVTRQQIEDQGLASLPDVLKQVPGLNYEQHDSERYGMFARGFEVGNFLVDGLPVSSYPAGAYGLLYQSQMDMVAFDRVEVVKGATGLASGAGQPSAGVNLVRKRPTATPQALLTGSWGSWDRARLEADVSGPLFGTRGLRGRAAAAAEHKHSFIDRYARRNASAFGIVEADLGARTVVSVSAHRISSDVDGVPFGGAVPMFYRDGSRIALPRSFSQVPAWTRWTTDTTLVGADLEHAFANGWTARLSHSHQRSSSALQGVVWEGFAKPDGSGAWAWRDENLDQARRSATAANASGPFEWLGRRHELMLGLSRTVSRAADDNYYDWDGYAPARFPADAASLPPLTREERVWASTVHERITETAAYGAVRLRPTDALALVLGSRLSTWKNARSTRDDVGTQASGYEHERIASPYVGAVLDLGPAWSAYASYTDIFTPQSHRDRQRELLGPVKGGAWETGLKAEFFGGRLNASFALFRIKQDNLAEETGEIVDGDPVYVGVAGAVATGVEAELGGELAPGWQVNAGLGQHRVRDAAGRPVLTASARRTAKLYTRYRFSGDWQRLALGAGWRWQGSTYKDKVGPDNDRVAGTADDRLSQGAYGVVDLSASYELRRGLDLSVQLLNLFDKTYLTAFRQGSQYGSPRSASVTLKARF